MKKKVCIFTAVMVVLLVAISGALAAGHGKKLQPKNAILLVAFGTSVPQALKAFDQIE